jgi:hypothetical protein
VTIIFSWSKRVPGAVAPELDIGRLADMARAFRRGAGVFDLSVIGQGVGEQ